MFPNELRTKLAMEYGNKGLPYPNKMEVDAHTYATVCDLLFKTHFVDFDGYPTVHIALGPNKGVMFKSVELILRTS